MFRFLLFFFCAFAAIPVWSAPPKTPLERSMEQQGMIEVTTVVPDVFVSLMYARPDNFVGRVMYRDLHRAYLHPQAAKALQRAQAALKQKYPQYSLIIYDATRPMSVQQIMWDAVKGTPKHIYVSNPKRGGGLHNYGLAVDVTLCWAKDQYDAKGKLLHTAGDTAGISMGTPIDYLGRAAHVRDETALLREKRLTTRHIQNRKILREAMAAGGYKVLATEWWHFNFKTRAQARAHYTPIR